MTSLDSIILDDDLKKKIESTKFVYVSAPSGTGKTFVGDYLEAIMGWKHIDGDIPLKEKTVSEHYTDIADRFMMSGKYEHLKTNMKCKKSQDEWYKKEGYPPYFTELARLTLLAAKENDKVVLSHFSSLASQRLFLRQKLIEAGAKPENITMIFLKCDRKVHDAGVWKRWKFQADAAGSTTEEFFKAFCGIEGVVDFDAFVTKIQDFWIAGYIQPQESEKPFKVIDVTARDVTVLDSVDKALGIENTRPSDLTYKEMQETIKKIDQERDKKWGEREAHEHNNEAAKKDPEKYAARRSTALEAEMIDTIRRLSIASDGRESNYRKTRESFVLTGKVTMCD